MKPFFWIRHQMARVGFLLLFLWSSYLSFGQTQSTSLLNLPPPETHLQQSDNMLRWLDKSPITTGILYDRMFPLADVESFNGQLDAGTSHSEHFFQSYYELHSASYNTNGRPSLDQLRSNVNEVWSSNHYPIGMICFQYNVLDDNAVNDNLLQYDSGSNTFSDVPGRSRSPYLTRTSMLASPLLHNFTPIMKPGIHHFHFSPQFIFTNAGLSVNYCQIDFGDGGGWRTLYPNNSVAINYPTVGDRTIHTVAYLSNGQQLHAYSVARVAASNADDSSWADWNDGEICNQPPTVIDITGDPFNPFQYGDGNVYGAKGKIYIYFAWGNCQTKVLRKPVVFLDGFDPTNSRGHKQIYKDKINDEDEGGSQLKLGDKYRNEGLDVVIIDYEDGGDYIERNGLMVIKALEELWNRYSSTIEQNFTLIGPSMGALVGQYALAEAERRGINHHTRTYISFDGPHQGANIAIGLQQAIGYALKSKIAAPSPANACRPATSGIVEDDFPLNVRAAKQLLMHHYLTNQEEPTAHPYRSVFVNNMNAVGYPNNCRKVAIVNGSRRADTQLAGENLNRVMLASEEILYLRLWGNLGLRRGVDILSWNLKATPINNRQITLHAFTAKIPSKLLGLNQFRDDFASPFNYAPSRSVDILPGGNINEIQEVVKVVNDNESVKFTAASICLNIGTIRSGWGGDFILKFFLQFRLKLKNGTNFTVQSNTPIHSFVPTLSAVDFRGGTPWSYNFENENLVCSGKTPFNQVYAPLTNQSHATVNSESAIWFANEIKQENLPAGCSTNSTCPNVGSISYQRWENIGGGTSIQDLRNNTNNLNNGSSHTQTLNSFEAPLNILDNYGVRIRGYVCPPTTGNYTFWVAGDDNAELWISPNDQPSNLSRIAYHTNWTPSLEWGWFSTQQSAPVTLQAGQRYYVEALMKEGAGGDNLAVGWQLPNGALERPIPGNRLIPFDGGSGGNCNFSVSPSSSNQNPSCGASITLNANCSGSDCGSVNYSWSGNGLSSNNSSVTTNAPSSNGTYTYTVTASKSGCNNQSGNVNITVSGCSGGTLNQCIEAESSFGTGQVTSDPNASNGETRGEENNYSHYVDYMVTNVPSAGTYYVKLRYYSSSAPAIGVQVNGGGGGNFSLPSSGSWNIVWAEYTFTVSLSVGTNTIRIQGTGGGSCRQDRICVSSNPPRIGVEKESSLTEDEESQGLQLYPNPTDGKVMVRYKLEKGQKANLQFMNAKGQVLIQKGLVGEGDWGQNQADLSAQPDGVYVVRMEIQQKTVSRKFVIVK